MAGSVEQEELKKILTSTEVKVEPEIAEHTERVEKRTTTLGSISQTDDQSSVDPSARVRVSIGQDTTTPAVTITVPTDPQTLLAQSKGTPTNALTWFAMFWLRMIKKALHFGWKIVGISSSSSTSTRGDFNTSTSSSARNATQSVADGSISTGTVKDNNQINK